MGALVIHVLAVVQPVVVRVVVTGWKQRSEAHLFGQRSLGITADTQQRLEVIPAAITQGQRCANGLARSLGDQCARAVGGARQHLGL
ncbi:hypothetical protein D3C77_584840 [compost metagenome]